MMSKHLYELTGEYEAILAAIEVAEGEITDEQVQALDALGQSIEVKVENVAKFIRCIEADGAAFKAEAARFAAKQKAAENKAASLKDYLLDCMGRAGRDKIKGQLLTVAVQFAAEKPDTIDENVLPKAFWRSPEPPPPTPDKAAIMDAHKAGQEVPGVTYTRTPYIRIR